MSLINKFNVNGKVFNTNIVNDLSTGGAESALSAEQGKILKNSIDTLESSVKSLNYYDGQYYSLGEPNSRLQQLSKSDIVQSIYFNYGGLYEWNDNNSININEVNIYSLTPLKPFPTYIYKIYNINEDDPNIFDSSKIMDVSLVNGINTFTLDKSVVLNKGEYLGISGFVTYDYIDASSFMIADHSINTKDYGYIISLNYGYSSSKSVKDVVTENKSYIKNIESSINVLSNSLDNNSYKKIDEYVCLFSCSLTDSSTNFTASGNWTYSTDGATPSTTGDTCYLKCTNIYNSDKRFLRFRVKLGADTKILIPVSNGSVLNAGEGASCFGIDMSNKKIIIYSSSNSSDTQGTASGYNLSNELDTSVFSDEMAHEGWFTVEVHKDVITNTITLMDELSGCSASVSHTGWGSGRQNEYYSIYCDSGTLPTIKDFQVWSLNRPEVCFVGDSITEGVYVLDRTKTYGNLFRANNPDKRVVISARGGDTINGILSKFTTEYNIYKPKFMVVTIGANGGNSESNLTELYNKCTAIGCTLILNNNTCHSSPSATTASTNYHIARNELIESVRSKFGLNGAKLDVATADQYHPEFDDTYTGIRANKSLYYDTFLHPNIAGQEKMYQRLKIDVPELFYKS